MSKLFILLKAIFDALKDGVLTVDEVIELIEIIKTLWKKEVTNGTLQK